MQVLELPQILLTGWMTLPCVCVHFCGILLVSISVKIPISTNVYFKKINNQFKMIPISIKIIYSCSSHTVCIIKQ